MNETTDLTAVLAPLWKRKWLILAIALVVAAGSYIYYKRQSPVYSASTEIYLGNGAEEQSQIGAATAGGKKASAPNPTTQAALINSSIIKEAVRDRLHRERKTAPVRTALKGKAKAKASEKSEFIGIEGEAHSAGGAALLVNTTAQAYVKRKNAQYHAQVQAAIALARRQLRKLEAGQIESLITSTSAAKGNTSAKGPSSAATIQSATLSAKINQLESDLGISQVTQVDLAKPWQSVRVSPHPRSNAIFGFAIGLVLATIAAYVLGRLDRRLRSLSAVEEVFQTQILAALRTVRHPLISRDGHPAPAYALREALWRLQTTLRMGGNGGENGRGGGPSTILCVSADAGDGKSTLIAALALTWAETGKRVAVVEADFRRPVQARLLDVNGPYGLADVLTGKIAVGEAMQSVTPAARVGVAADPAEPLGGIATVVEASDVGRVSVLVGGGAVANPPALLARPEMNEMLRSIADEFDYILIDAPPPLEVSDVMPLLATVDGIVVVARIGHTRDVSLQRLAQMLGRTASAPLLGIVANCVPRKDIERYGFALAPTGSWRRRKLIG